MQTRAAGGAEFVQLKPQQQAKIVVEITEATREKIRGRLLEKQDETHYTRTASTVEIVWSSETKSRETKNGETKIAMGKIEDVRAGAVVYVTGTVGADGAVQASQIVILTGYVQLD
jgi:hypothetical protein